jgi:hypothetical protein
VDKVSYTPDGGTIIERDGEVFKVVGDLEVNKEDCLLVIPKEIVTKFIIEMVANICKKMDCEHIYSKTENKMNVITIITTTGEQLIKLINKEISKSFSNFIEKETGKSATKFYRNLIMFESNVQNNMIQLVWG